MKKFLCVAVIFASAIHGLSGMCWADVVLFDLDSGAVAEIGDAMIAVTELTDIQGITALDVLPGGGDDWLLVEGTATAEAESQLVCIDVQSFDVMFRLNESDLRSLFGLPTGEGACSSIHLSNRPVDTLLYYDAVYGDWYFIDLITGNTGVFSDIDLMQPFYAGFSYTGSTDIGLFVRNNDGFWWFEPLPERTPVDLDLATLFGADPNHVTEFEYSGSSITFRFVIGVTEGTGPATPTPTPGPGTPTATPTSGTADYDVVVVHGGSSEDLWRIHSGDYSVEPGMAATGASANQIVFHENELFVVNSLSHSVTVYDADTVAFKREMSTGIGKNPFALDFVDSDHFYVTQFNANEVTKMNAFTGTVETSIPLPEDLPSDPGETTLPRPEGIVVVDNVAYVACCNLNDNYIAGGPGIIVRIDINQDRVTGWSESGGRDCVGVFADPRWTDCIWTANAGDYTPGSGYDSNGTIGIYAINSGTVTDSIPVSDAPFEIVFGDDRAYFSSAVDGLVGRLNLGDLSLLPPVSLPNAGQGLNFVSGMKFGNDGRLWVLEFNHDKLFTLDTTQNDTLVHEMTVGDGPDDLIIIE